MSELPIGVHRRPWLAVILWLCVTVLLMVASAYLWVFVYATLINASGNEADYQAYARDASPVVAVVVAFPVFWVMGRFMRRYGERARWAALAVVGLNLVMDGVVVATLAVDVPYNAAMSVIAAAAKVAGAWVGSKGLA